jgi:protein-disulfide isomerase
VEAQAAEPFSVPNVIVNYFIIAILFLAVGVLISLMVGGTFFRDTIRDTVRDTVNTELAVVMEDVLSGVEFSGGTGMDAEALQELVMEAVREVSRQESLLTGDDPSIGPPDAPVVMVEFSDFLCPFCGRHSQQTLEPILENYEGLIHYVYRDFPSVGGQNAVESAMAAECADDQGAFWNYHDLLFADQDALRTNDLGQLRSVLIGYAQSLELDEDTFIECLDSDKYLSDVIQDASEGQKNGVSGTPGFFINGTFVSGAQPYEIFASIINAELRGQGIEPPEIELPTPLPTAATEQTMTEEATAEATSE